MDPGSKSILGFPPPASSSPPSPRLNCKSLFSAQGTKSNPFNLTYIPSSDSVDFFADEIASGSSKWSRALVGYALGKRPFYESLQQAIGKLWKLKGSIDLISLTDGFFLFNFNCDEDLEMVLQGGPWFLLGRPFLFKCWTPEFTPIRENFAEVPIWIKLPNLPLCCWTEQGISKIASFIGTSLAVDPLTAKGTHLTYARVCLQISVTSPLPETISISLNGTRHLQQVIYVWKPTPCLSCNTFAHSPSNCPASPNYQPPVSLLPSRRRQSRPPRAARPRHSLSLTLITIPPPIASHPDLNLPVAPILKDAASVTGDDSTNSSADEPPESVAGTNREQPSSPLHMDISSGSHPSPLPALLDITGNQNSNEDFSPFQTVITKNRKGRLKGSSSSTSIK